jgi:deoxyribodipyrimidine photo-lyase
MKAPTTCIWWIRTDIRLGYHAELFNALHRFDYLVPIYCIAEDSKSNYGIPTMGIHRQRFRDQSVNELRQELRDRNSELLILKGNAVEQLRNLLLFFPDAEVICEKATAWYEIQAERQLISYGIQLNFYPTHTLFTEHQLPFELSALHDTYTPFRKQVEHLKPNYRELITPSILPPYPYHLIDLASVDLPEISASVRYTGGRQAGLQRLQSYFMNSGNLAQYKETRNGMLDENDSAKISPWLAWGCLHVQEVWQAVLDFEQEQESNASTLWMKYELLWREYFKWLELKYGPRMYTLNNIKSGGAPKGHWDADTFTQWCRGETGDPLTDAGMRELFQTGYSSNRARQNMASYLIYDLHQPWIAGAQWFEYLLTDYDPASNYGNWAYIAGSGCTPGSQRKFNTLKQKEIYDPEDLFTSFWLSK